MRTQALCFLLISATLAGSNLQGAGHVFASLTSGQVSVSHIDAVTGEQSHVYPTAPGVTYLAVSPGGREALFLAPSSKTVGFVNLSTGALSPVLTLTGTPATAFFSKDGRTVFVIGSDIVQSGESNIDTLHVFAIDAVTREVSIDVKYPSLEGPAACCGLNIGYAISPDRSKLYLLTNNTAGNVIAVFSLPSFALAQTVTVGRTGSPMIYFQTIAATSDGQYLVLGGGAVNRDHQNGELLALYTTSTYQEVKSVALPGQIETLVASPTLTSVYGVVQMPSGSPYVTTISVPSLTMSQPVTFTTNDFFQDMAISADGTKLLAGASILDVNSQTFQQISSLSGDVQGQFSDAGDLWIVNEYSTQVAVLDETGSVVSSLVSTGSQGVIAAGPPATLYFLRDGYIDTIDVIARTIAGTSQISSVHQPNLLAAAGGKVFVAGFGATLASYDPATGQQEPVSLPELCGGDTSIVNMVLSPTGNQLYVGLFAESSCPSSAVVAINTSTGVLEEKFALNPEGGMAVNNRTLFVATASDGLGAGITVIDLTGKSGTRVFSFPTITLGFSSLLVSPDGSTLYGLGAYNPTVTVISTATGSILATYSGFTNAATMALSSDGTELYLSSVSSNDLTVLNTSSGIETKLNVGSPTAFVTASRW